jgi:hypothetical protein
MGIELLKSAWVANRFRRLEPGSQMGYPGGQKRVPLRIGTQVDQQVRRVTICSDLNLWMAMTSFLLGGFSHSTW